jgi:TRAP-type mannitol/chloroaromatic compound transport system substrate-binding protein
MRRRAFLASGGLGLAGAAALAAPAIAQSQPEIKWRLASSFPKSLDTLYGGAERFTKQIAEATDNKFQIRVFAGGEIVPPFQVLDAVQNNTVEIGHSASYYYVGKDPTFAIDSTIPFGMNARQMNAWMMHGGGMDLLRNFFKEYNVYNLPAGNTGAQMGGWWRKEIKTLADLKGVKMRIAGLAGEVFGRLGVVAQQIPGGDIYPALEKGTIDAAEWVGPYDDEKLGFYKVAKYYYYPGWWEGQTQNTMYINLDQWNKLPKSYQAAVTGAAADTYQWMLGKYDTDNVAALRRLVGNGAELRAFSREILDASYKATQEYYAELTQKNSKWKAVYEPWRRFLDDEIQWFRLNELSFDAYMATTLKKA